MIKSFEQDQLDAVFSLLDARLALNNAPPVGLVVGGGAALIALKLLARATNDVDVVALMDDARRLIVPEPLPPPLLQAAHEVAGPLRLPENWLNNAPSRDAGGLFQLGLPEGFAERLHPRQYGAHLTVFFIDRIDQIHFKLYAAIDRGGYHVTDLEALQPSTEELIQAARWACTHDVSPGFRALLKDFLEKMGYGNAAETF